MNAYQGEQNLSMFFTGCKDEALHTGLQLLSNHDIVISIGIR